jgi:phosphatidylserine decarboxylase
LWTAGQEILIGTVVVAVVAFFVYRPLLYVAVLFFLFSLYFFRNPARHCVESDYDDTVILCPADGKIVDIQYDPTGGFDGYERKVSIFLSPLDVHVNWVPTNGMVSAVVYRPGTFSMAFLPKSSALNERNDLVITTPFGESILVRQIAGTLARRICCWVEKDSLVVKGQKFGMIRFGSRVDILLPATTELAVGFGQRVYGGQTVLGRWQWR